eukprot:7832501-Lingulodinium_polyedra.AAC.1
MARASAMNRWRWRAASMAGGTCFFSAMKGYGNCGVRCLLGRVSVPVCGRGACPCPCPCFFGACVSVCVLVSVYERRCALACASA